VSETVTAPRTLEVLVADGVIDGPQTEIVLAQQRFLREVGVGKAVGELLVENGFAAREAISNAVMRTANSANHVGSSQLLLPFHVCLRFRVLPLRVERGQLVVQTSNPLRESDRRALLALAAEFLPEHSLRGVTEKPVPRSMIESELASLRHVAAASLGESLSVLGGDLENGELMSRVLAELFVTGAVRRASDIHIQWNDRVEGHSWISFRIDGVLRREHTVSRAIAAAVTRRIKDLAGMDASESVRSQNGRHTFEFLNRFIDVRIEAQPTIVGETLIMRLLDPAKLRALDELFPGCDDICRHLREITAVKGKEGGILIVSGPTGSGKTTTLYAMVREMPRHSLHVVTIEDPIEYQFAFCTQIQYNAYTQKSMAESLRSVMRQDPDVIVVGEMRDGDTTSLGMSASESGHLLISTLHASDCYQVYDRLLDLHPGEAKEAIAPLANNLLGSIHQKLAQRVCVHCAERIALEEEDPLRIELGLTEATAGGGCVQCDQTGYFGLVAVPEALFIAPREKTRQKVIDHFRAGGNLRTLPVGDGVAVFKRSDAVRDLMAKGIVDPVWGARLLGLRAAYA